MDENTSSFKRPGNWPEHEEAKRSKLAGSVPPDKQQDPTYSKHNDEAVQCVDTNKESCMESHSAEGVLEKLAEPVPPDKQQDPTYSKHNDEAVQCVDTNKECCMESHSAEGVLEKLAEPVPPDKQQDPTYSKHNDEAVQCVDTNKECCMESHSAEGVLEKLAEPVPPDKQQDPTYSKHNDEAVQCVDTNKECCMESHSAEGVLEKLAEPVPPDKQQDPTYSKHNDEAVLCVDTNKESCMESHSAEGVLEKLAEPVPPDKQQDPTYSKHNDEAVQCVDTNKECCMESHSAESVLEKPLDTEYPDPCSGSAENGQDLQQKSNDISKGPAHSLAHKPHIDELCSADLATSISNDSIFTQIQSIFIKSMHTEVTEQIFHDIVGKGPDLKTSPHYITEFKKEVHDTLNNLNKGDSDWHWVKVYELYRQHHGVASDLRRFAKICNRNDDTLPDIKIKALGIISGRLFSEMKNNKRFTEYLNTVNTMAVSLYKKCMKFIIETILQNSTAQFKMEDAVRIYNQYRTPNDDIELMRKCATELAEIARKDTSANEVIQQLDHWKNYQVRGRSSIFDIIKFRESIMVRYIMDKYKSVSFFHINLFLYEIRDSLANLLRIKNNRSLIPWQLMKLFTEKTAMSLYCNVYEGIVQAMPQQNEISQSADAIHKEHSGTEASVLRLPPTEMDQDLQQKTHDISKVPAHSLAQDTHNDQLCSQDLATSISNQSIFTQIQSIFIKSMQTEVTEQIFCDLVNICIKGHKTRPHYIETFKKEVQYTLNNLNKSDSDFHWAKVYELYRRHHDEASDQRRFMEISNQNDYTIPDNHEVQISGQTHDSITDGTLSDIAIIAGMIFDKVQSKEIFKQYFKTHKTSNFSLFLFKQCIKFIIETIQEKSTALLKVNDVVRIYNQYRSPNDDIELMRKCVAELEEVARKDTSANKLIGQLGHWQNYAVTSTSSFFNIIKFKESRIVHHIMNTHKNVSFVHINLLLYEIRDKLTRRLRDKSTKSFYPSKLFKTLSRKNEMKFYSNIYEGIIQAVPQQNEMSQSADASHKEHSGTEASVLCLPPMEKDQDAIHKEHSGTEASVLCLPSTEINQDLKQKTHDISKVPAHSLAQKPHIEELCSEDLARSISNHSIFTQIHSIFIKSVHNKVTDQLLGDLYNVYGKSIKRYPHYIDTFRKDVQCKLNNLNKGDSDWHWAKVYELYRRHYDLVSDQERYMKLYKQSYYELPNNKTDASSIATRLFHEGKSNARFKPYLNTFLFKQCIRSIVETILQNSTARLEMEDAVRIYNQCRTPNDDIELMRKCETEISEIARKDTSANEVIRQLAHWQNYKVTSTSSIFDIIKLRESQIVHHIMNKCENVSFVHINLLLYKIRDHLAMLLRVQKIRCLSPCRLLQSFSERTELNTYWNTFCVIIQAVPQQNEMSQSADTSHKEHSGTEASVLCLPPAETDQDLQQKTHDISKVPAHSLAQDTHNDQLCSEDLATSISNQSIFTQIQSIFIKSMHTIVAEQIFCDLVIKYGKHIKKRPHCVEKFKKEIQIMLNSLNKGDSDWHWAKVYELYRRHHDVTFDWGRFTEICKQNDDMKPGNQGFQTSNQPHGSITDKTMSNKVSSIAGIIFCKAKSNKTFTQYFKTHTNTISVFLFNQCTKFIIETILEKSSIHLQVRDVVRIYNQYRSPNDAIALMSKCETELAEIAHKDTSANEVIEQLHHWQNYIINNQSSFFDIMKLRESQIVHHIMIKYKNVSFCYINILLYEIKDTLTRLKGVTHLSPKQLLVMFSERTKMNWCINILDGIFRTIPQLHEMSQSADAIHKKHSGAETSVMCLPPKEMDQDLKQKTHDISKVPAHSLAQDTHNDELWSQDLATSISNQSIFTQIHSIFIQIVQTKVTDQIICDLANKYGRSYRKGTHKFKKEVQCILNNLNKSDSDLHWAKMYELYRQNHDMASDQQRFMKISNQNDNTIPDNPIHTTNQSISDQTRVAKTDITVKVLKIIFLEAKNDERFTEYLTYTRTTNVLFKQCLRFIIETIKQTSTTQLEVPDVVRIYNQYRSSNDDIELMRKCETEMAEVARKDTSANEVIRQLDHWQNYKVTKKSSIFDIIKLRESQIVHHIKDKYKNVSFVHINLLLYEIRNQLPVLLKLRLTKFFSLSQLLQIFSEKTDINKYCNIYEGIVQAMPQQNKMSQSADAIHKEHSGTEASVLCLPPTETDQDASHKEHSGTEASVLRLSPTETDQDAIHKEHSGTEASILRLPPAETNQGLEQNVRNLLKRKLDGVVDKMIKRHKEELTLEVERNTDVNLEHATATDNMEIVKEIDLKNESEDIEMIDSEEAIPKRDESLKMSVEEIIDGYLESILPEMKKRVISSISEDNQLLQYLASKQPKTVFRLVKLTARTTLPDLTKLLEVLKKYKPVSIKMHKLMLTTIFADIQDWKQLTALRDITIDGKTVDITLGEETLHSDHNLISITPDALTLYQTIDKNNKETTIHSYAPVENVNVVSREEGSVYSATLSQDNEDQNREILQTVSHKEDNAIDRPLTINSKVKNYVNVEIVTQNNEDRNHENLLNVSHKGDSAKDNKGKNLENPCNECLEEREVSEEPSTKEIEYGNIENTSDAADEEDFDNLINSFDTELEDLLSTIRESEDFEVY